MLLDIVSKNGNLLINVVQRPDGSLDPEAEKVLAEMATWIAINGEGIYETRPWLIKLSGEDLRGFKPELAVPAASLFQPDVSGSLGLLRGIEPIPDSR